MQEEIDEKSGDTILEVLASKHLDAQTPNASSLNKYTNTLNVIDVTEETVCQEGCLASLW